MKTPNLLSAQQQYLPSNERSNQKLCQIALFLPISICVLLALFTLGDSEALFSIVFMSIRMLLVSLLLFFVLKQLQKKYLKRFTEKQLARIEAECLSAPQYEGLMVSSEALMYFMPVILALPIQELVWIYPVVTTYRKGLFSKTCYTIVAITKDKKQHNLLRENMDSERMENSMIFLNEHLKELRPYLLFGYSEQLYNIFRKDFNRMIQMADHGTGFSIDTTLPENITKPLEQSF